ncbi:MAG: hypothetical protein LBC92_05285 [Rickettsiales bacterium]|nr:hypothetical protein [Rickettsiales bacterium]
MFFEKKDKPLDSDRITGVIAALAYANSPYCINNKQKNKILRIISTNVEPELLQKVEKTLKEIQTTVNDLDKNGKTKEFDLTTSKYELTKSSDGETISFNLVTKSKDGELVSNNINDTINVKELNNTIDASIEQCQSIIRIKQPPQSPKLEPVSQQSQSTQQPKQGESNEQRLVIKSKTKVRQFSPVSDSITPACTVYKKSVRHPADLTPDNAISSTIKEKPNITLTSLFSEESEENKRIRDDRIAQLNKITETKREKKEAKKEAFKNWCKELNRD